MSSYIPFDPNVSSISEDEFQDEWLQKSLTRSEKSDPEFNLDQFDDIGDDIVMTVKRSTNINNDRVLLVYESKLLELLHTCRKCYGPIIEKNEKNGDGTQIRYEMVCLNGCQTFWSSQPSLSSVAGNHITLYFTIHIESDMSIDCFVLF